MNLLSGALGGSRYGIDRIPDRIDLHGRVGIKLEMDRAEAERMVQKAHPEFVGPFAEWGIDDEDFLDLLCAEVERWMATCPAFNG